MNVRAADWSPTAPNPDDTLILTCPYPIALRDADRIASLVRELGFEDRRSELLRASGGRVTQVCRWTLDVVHSAIRAAWTGNVGPEVVYLAVRRALRACVDPEFRKAFWAARLLGGYEAGGAYLSANAPKRRVNRTAKDVLDALDAAWRLHDPEALQPITDALNAIPPGASAKINGCTVRRGKPYGNEYRWWIESPYMGREFSTPREPQRLLRPLWEASLLATMGGGRLGRPPRR